MDLPGCTGVEPGGYLHLQQLMICKTIVTSYKFQKTSKLELETRPTITAIALSIQVFWLETGQGLRDDTLRTMSASSFCSYAPLKVFNNRIPIVKHFYQCRMIERPLKNVSTWFPAELRVGWAKTREMIGVGPIYVGLSHPGPGSHQRALKCIRTCRGVRGTTRTCLTLTHSHSLTPSNSFTLSRIRSRTCIDPIQCNAERRFPLQEIICIKLMKSDRKLRASGEGSRRRIYWTLHKKRPSPPCTASPYPQILYQNCFNLEHLGNEICYLSCSLPVLLKLLRICFVDFQRFKLKHTPCEIAGGARDQRLSKVRFWRRANLAQVRQSRPDSGLGSQVKGH